MTKIIPYRRARGNIKMRGRRTASLSCGCCDAFNFKKLLEEDRGRKEIREYKKDKDEN